MAVSKAGERILPEGMEGSVKWEGPTMAVPPSLAHSLSLSFLNGCIILHGRKEPPQFSPGNEAEFGMLADRLVQ